MGSVVLDMVLVFWTECMCSGYGAVVLEYESVFLERVWLFWIRICCSGVREGVLE